MIRTGLLVAVVLLVAGLVLHRRVSAQLTPATLRFRLVSDELIASPDGMTTVAASKVLVFRDTRRAQCYVAFVLPTGTSTVSMGACTE